MFSASNSKFFVAHLIKKNKTIGTIVLKWMVRDLLKGKTKAIKSLLRLLGF